jgi:ABC-type multidrug transport system ATPase subunit
MLEINNLKLSFGDKEILKGVSFEIRLNQFVGLVGDVSSGKSQIFETILNFKNFSGGTVIYENKKVAYNRIEQVAALRKNIGYVPQYNIFLDFGNLLENLMFISGQKKDSVIEIVSSLEITDSLYKNIDQIDNEDVFRAKIALALLKNPQILLIDEPLIYGDIITMKNIIKVIQKILFDKQVAVLMASQKIELFDQDVFNKIYKLENGVLNAI